MRTVIYSMGVSLDCYIAGPDGNGWGAPLTPSCTASTISRQASSACIYLDDASTR